MPWACQVEKTIESQTHEMTEQYTLLVDRRTKCRAEIKELEELLAVKRKEEAQASRSIEDVGGWTVSWQLGAPRIAVAVAVVVVSSLLLLRCSSCCHYAV